MESYPEAEKLKYSYERRMERRIQPIINTNPAVSTFNRQSHFCMDIFEQQQQQQATMEETKNEAAPLLKSCDQLEHKTFAKENESKMPLERFKLTNSDEGMKKLSNKFMFNCKCFIPLLHLFFYSNSKFFNSFSYYNEDSYAVKSFELRFIALLV